MATDQEIRNRGFNFIPNQNFLQTPFQLPTTTDDEPVINAGIVNTNAFAGSGGGGGALQAGDPMLNFNNFYNYTGNKYMQGQPTPELDMNYDQQLQSKFMGFPTYRQQELTGPDIGEYIASNKDIPLELTRAGSMQQGLQSAGQGIRSLMGMAPLNAILSRAGRFNTLPELDQKFIQTNAGYRGPTVFGENTAGGSVDPFGMNVESGFGNYAQGVRDNFEQLQDTLTNKDRGNVTFNEETGEFEGEDADNANKQTELIRQKFLFRRNQINQQQKNERDLAKKQEIQAEINRRESERVGAVQGLLDERGYVSRDDDGFSSSDRAVGGGKTGRAANTDNDKSTGTEQGYSQHFVRGGLVSIL